MTAVGPPAAAGATMSTGVPDLDELLGFVAAEANHSTDKRLRKELDALYARVRRQMESYDDGLWQQAF